MSEQPKDDRLPARFDQDALRKTEAQLTRMVRGYARDRARIRQLPTFSDRTKGNLTRKKAQVEWQDRPEVELYLKHRDSYEEHTRDLEEWRSKLPSMPVLEWPSVLDSISRAEVTRAKHLASMEAILAGLQKEFTAREVVMAKLAADGAKIAEAARQHEERIDLLERMKNLDASGDTDEDKIAKLAKKFNMSPEELRAKLASGQFGILPREDDDDGAAVAG